MDLHLDEAIGRPYKSKSQAARRMTEAWAAGNLFCVACPADRILAERPNTPVRDYTCAGCGATYQLKSQDSAFGRAVQNSAYGPKMAAIEEGRAPHYVFLQYSRTTWSVTNLFVVPGHFISPAVVQRRNPLGPRARRRGWVGSNILLGGLPLDARVVMVSGGTVREPDRVRVDWARYAFLGADRRSRGGWGADTLSCIRTLQEETGARDFTLQAFYARFKKELASWHPANQNVEAKIRQQLQVMRDGNVLLFLGRGRYRVLS
jgi:type II restriction enzyme